MTDIFAKELKFLLILCAVALVIPISGCISPTPSGTGGLGLVIENFKTTLDTVDSSEPVGLNLEVRNRGDYNGMIGAGVPAVAEIMSIDPTEWAVTPSTIVDMGTMLAPDLESQTQGGLGKANWELIAPILQRGQRKTYEIRARVYYPYETKAIKPVWFVTAEELRRIVQVGDALPSDAGTQTSGPLTVTVTAGQFVKANEFKDSKFQLQIRVDNSGSGQIRGRNYPVAVAVKWPMWVMPVGGFCPLQTQIVTPFYNDVPAILPPLPGTYIYLWNGKTTDLTCEFQIIQPPASRTQGNFEVSLGYIYSVDATTQITVKGTEEI
jgi:hypothetical protein